MLHHHIRSLGLVRHADLIEELVGRLAHDHGGKELSTEPGAPARGHARLNDGDLELGPRLGQAVGAAQAAAASADDDNVALSVFVHVLEVAARHSAVDGALTDGLELEVVDPIVLGQAVDRHAHHRLLRYGDAIVVGESRLGHCRGWWRWWSHSCCDLGAGKASIYTPPTGGVARGCGAGIRNRLLCKKKRWKCAARQAGRLPFRHSSMLNICTLTPFGHDRTWSGDICYGKSMVYIWLLFVHLVHAIDKKLVFRRLKALCFVRASRARMGEHAGTWLISDRYTAYRASSLSWF